jgi:hypothetical protein
MVHVNGYWGGARRGVPNKFPPTPAKWCAPYGAGMGPTINTSVAVTWKAGASLPEVGFNVQATTGYDVDGEIVFSLSARRWLCGEDGLAAGPHPRQIVVRQRKV